jgi:hypothetical protein
MSMSFSTEIIVALKGKKAHSTRLPHRMPFPDNTMVLFQGLADPDRLGFEKGLRRSRFLLLSAILRCFNCPKRGPLKMYDS